jgi:hypothetical protein
MRNIIIKILAYLIVVIPTIIIIYFTGFNDMWMITIGIMIGWTEVPD